MSAWALVSPASRGIGFALTRQLLTTTKVPVVATARKDVDQVKESLLEGLKDVQDERLHVLKADVLDEQSIEDAASQAKSLFSNSKDSYLHLAFAIPGILYPEKAPSQIDYDKALETFRVNALGPMLLLKHFSPFLPRKSTQLKELEGLPQQAVWANMSARVGSVSDNHLGGWYSYRASKSAVNQITKTFDNHLRVSSGDKSIAIALHPGTVKTQLSKEFWSNVKEDKLFTPEYSAERLMEVVKSRSLDDRGKIWDWKGEQIHP